jgi:hypothetical protein
MRTPKAKEILRSYGYLISNWNVLDLINKARISRDGFKY